jgi:aminocarboxymuconate-semialdehyde decarboxylase
VKDLGLRHFGLGTSFDGLNFDHPDIVPVLNAIAEAGATISTHPVFFDALGTPDRLTSPFLRGGLASPFEAGLSVATIIASGVLDRYPDFRVWVSHGGGTSMYAMGRLDRRWGALAEADRPAANVPSDYLRRFWFGNLLHGDTELEFLMAMVGVDRVTVGTDYPFEWDHVGGSANWIRSADFLDDGERRQVLWGNAATFLGVEPPWTEEDE